MLRRDFLKSMLIGGVCAPLLIPQQLLATPHPLVPTVLWARRGNEEYRLDYATDEGYKKIAWLLRDIRAGDVVGIPDGRLLQLNSWMQAWLAAYGHHVCFIYHSGLRTPQTNTNTEGATQASFHLPDARGVFRASDFSTREISSDYLGRLAALARQGGVGFYTNRHFTHLDTGNVRYWQR